jgi:hypothetical protein
MDPIHAHDRKKINYTLVLYLTAIEVSGNKGGCFNIQGTILN